jgi:lipopolysaccharide/colanic/teichoic acid biosynthesis glycosyltransferase
VGRNGRRFNAYKFRTMYINGEEILANYPYVRAQLRKEYNLKCDPRLTRIGYYLRRLGLDELPQLFNVLKQDMSLVGPRIVTYKELMKYEHHRQTLLSVMPGLTGLWQINGRPDMSFEERVEMDLEYIHNWSLKNDIKILLGTVPALFKGYRNQ